VWPVARTGPRATSTCWWDLPPHIGLLGLGRVQADLEAILGAKVDLVPASDLKPAVRARTEHELMAL
jgi:predicted nucleotidyltransferase